MLLLTSRLRGHTIRGSQLQLLDRMRAVLLAAILWWTAVVNCDSSEDEISTGIRIVETREQRVCEDVHEVRLAAASPPTHSRSESRFVSSPPLSSLSLNPVSRFSPLFVSAILLLPLHDPHQRKRIF